MGQSSSKKETTDPKKIAFNDIKAEAKKRADLGTTALHVAAERGNEGACNKLLLKGSQLDKADKEGMTALMLACKVDDERHHGVIRLLLARGASTHPHAKNGHTCLTLACEADNYTAVKAVLARGASVHASLKEDGSMPLHIALSKTKNLDLIKRLLEKGASVHKPNKEGVTPLAAAMKDGTPKNCSTEIITALINKGASINEAGDPLNKAVAGGNVEVMQLLASKGASVHAADKEGKTPLLVAVQRQDVDMVKLLLSKGPDVHKKTKEGITPLSAAIADGKPENCNTEIVSWLINKGAGINDDGDAMCTAVAGGNLELTKMLLARGVSVHKAGKDGQTPTQIAKASGQTAILDELRAAGGQE